MEEQSEESDKKKNWFLRHKVWTSIGGLFLLFSIVSASAHPGNPTPSSKAPVSKQQTQETKTTSETETIAFEKQQIDDATMNSGTSKVTQEGKDGSKTIVYQVVYIDGRETSRKQISSTISLEPIPQVTSVGTKVPAPAIKQTAPTTSSSQTYSSATAKCVDGSYSYSAHASGTCSHHGGVAQWINHPVN